MRSSIRPVRLRLKLLALLIAVALTGLLLVELTLAQESGGPWYEPVNLSRSAGTSEPVIVVDASGRAHVIWQDAGTSFAYTLGQNGTWREALQIELPFGTRRYYPELTERQATPLHTPVLWADGSDRVHAAWLDLEGQLLYSSVAATRFAEFSAWSAPLQLATSALGATAIVDDAGIIHVAYIRATSTAQSPSGLYHRVSVDGGETWSAPTLVYESQYFRSLAAEQINMHLAAANNGALVAAWDNPFEERVYFARSGNGGQDWEPPVEVDRRVQTDAVDAAGPNSIRVESVGDQFHLVWEAGHEGFLCAQYHQMSSDAGLTWESPQLLTSRDESCADTSFLVAGPNEMLTLFSMAEERGYISVWNGSQWGDTQTREQLTSFTNPANFRPVTLACFQVTSGASGLQGDTDTAIIIGCDTGTGDDVWAMSVALGPLNEDLAAQSSLAWQRPDVVSGPADSESLQLLADADGWLHASWVQRQAAEDDRPAAYYSRWDGIAWSQPNELLRTEDGQSVAQPTFALGPDDTLMAVWLDGEPGSVYFGQADVARASNLSEWSSPLMLPTPSDEVTAPELVVDSDGVIYVTYAVPLNEARGVYMTRSVDGGSTWSDPEQVFDGVVAGWSMVDSPHLAIGGEGTLHLMWSRLSSPPDATPQSFHYSRSDDGGQSWSESTEITGSPGTWSELLASGELAVHRLWLADSGDLWHQSSNDDGQSWEQPQRVSSGGGSAGTVRSVLDGAGRLWVLQEAGTRTEENEIRAPFELSSWVLSEGRWQPAEALQLGGLEIEELAATANSGGNLYVVFSSLASALGGDQEEQTIYFASRSLDLPAAQPTALPTLTPTPLPESTLAPTPEPLPTATTSFPTEQGQDGGLPIPIDTSNPLTGPLLGIIPAAAVVLVAFFIGVRLLRGDRRGPR